jgi:glycosyltransferase involved in cell wall biosynthesis
VKGTEYLINAVNELKNEGLQIELILLEKVKNDVVQKAMHQVDILADQFILTAYGLNAIEGMATGLPVMCNLEHEAYTRVFRRYAFLNECPILSTTPESLKSNLRLLITKPKLRRTLGEAGRKYVEKYHSYKTAQYLFGSIYDKILHGKNVDLINLFHPILSSYNKSLPYIKHPLVDNKYLGRMR